MAKLKVSKTLLFNLIIGALLLSLGGVIGYRYGKTGQDLRTIPLAQIINIDTPQEKNNIDFSIFWEAWNQLDRNYLFTEKLDAKKMVDGAIEGMVSAAGDHYTTYLPPKDNQRKTEDLAGAFYGVGIELGYIDSTLAVIAPLKDTPAYLAGVESGDLILHLKDDAKSLNEDTTNMTLNDAVEKIRGPKNTTISLTLLRKKDDKTYNEPFVVDIQRGEIIVASVELEFIEHNGAKVAHLSVSQFGERTPKEFEQAVGEILKQGYQLKGIVLDLRNNPGGFFDGAISLASEFFEKGVVVSQQGKIDKQDFSTQGVAKLQKFPLVILVNRGSASASEILAGALRDQRGAKLVGEKTFGKGTVQNIINLSNGGGLHITIARWLLPNGDWINETGIPADVEVKDNQDTKEDEVLLRAIEEL